jgi:rhamnose utilization protein RhaD (predicted bifunctional aldolase and dehydrogenase)
METYYRRNGKPVELLLLQNHGLFLAADSVEELEDMLERVLALLDEKLQRKPDMRPVDIAAEKIREVTQAITNCFEGKVVCVHENNREAVKFSANRLTVQPLMKPFTPDHIVYCKAYPLYAQSLSELPGAVAAYRAQHVHSPRRYGLSPTAASLPWMKPKKPPKRHACCSMTL